MACYIYIKLYNNERAMNTKYIFFTIPFFLACIFLAHMSPLQSQETVYVEEEVVEQQEEENEGYLINFPNVEIIEYIRFISQITNKNFIFKEEDLNFRVTILSEEPTSIENIIAALVQILRIHNLSLLEQGNNLLIHQNPDIKQVPKVVDSGAGESGFVTRVFQLKNTSPDEVITIVQSMSSKDSIVQVSKETNHLIVTDIGRNVDQVAALIERIDAPGSILEVNIYEVQYAHPDSLINTSGQILAPFTETSPLVMVPEHRSNSIYIVSTPYLVKKAIALLRSLDIPTEKQEQEELPIGHIDSTNFFVHKLQYHKGEKIVGALHKVAESLKSSNTTNMSLINAIKSVQWLEPTNSILFTGDGSALQKVKDLVSSLDVPVKQVFIEMLIIDTTISNALELGVDWTTSYTKGNTSLSFGAHPGGASSFGTGSTLAAASTLTGGPGFSLGIIGDRIFSGANHYSNLGALVTALQQDTNTEILLNPKIITQDNATAEIFVGGESAFQGSQNVSTSGNVITTSVDYQEVGARLKVSPILGNDNIITLEIEQEISEDLRDTGTSSQLGPVSTKSTTKTRVHVPDKHFLVMSGMIRERKTKVKQGLPCLGGIPGVGQAFSKNTDSVEKRNLLIFIRPHIITTEEEAKVFMRRQQKLFEKKTTKDHFLFEINDYIKE
jgi:type III secretion protein C